MSKPVPVSITLRMVTLGAKLTHKTLYFREEGACAMPAELRISIEDFEKLGEPQELVVSLAAPFRHCNIEEQAVLLGEPTLRTKEESK